MENTNNLTNESFNQNIENNPTSPIINTQPKQNNTFKILFIISILIVIGLVGFILFLLKNNTNQSTPVETKNQTEETATVSPTTEIITPTETTKTESLKSTVSEDNNVKCYQNDQYFIAVKESSSGYIFLVKSKETNKTEINCLYTKEGSDYEINTIAGSYLGLQQHFLLIDQGTGPSGRQLIIYDLDKNQKIYDVIYDGRVSVLNNQVVYWEVTKTKPTTENCSDLEENNKNGFGSVISNKITLTLTPFEKNTSTEFKCSATQ